ncbi:bifunctional ADP-dependent NAD(P)H-hydrate dehydratase/NAD(P)H-hydrate epimerase [Corynebacterium aquatimens]|uniref:ADP-dependent (S)-NAD(P)H-hydrate dehydratase n=1 Tax=Corynebacterium aquatimens TaxID=1190508 RepID=A0A931DWE5_9CORY|nr:bifunctional ADP-dependent NAD(P)H-hydrate dehydratase/NAD(P)H-hydrate epimerase [Corynebacterium aquatimens]MBG6122754.1 hydroxyethylthiazole kinase-like uncharacterized protein yjeF [Corynebacterium aquatimens]WJY66909.1 Bifunctional NAD(P)H-hydrate repair enzyme Nnr [Corynebacterium aquatimens]
MLLAYTADEIRAAEAPLLRTQAEPDELMKSAAHAVFLAAQSMLTWPDQVGHIRKDPRVLLLVGKGGNGGDALYAGVELLAAGHTVDAWLAWGTAHERALAAFTQAGGTVLPHDATDFRDYRLAIDGLTGLGGAGSLGEDVAKVLEELRGFWSRILSVDVPSGIVADTGEKGATHVVADATVTFGGWRYAHGLAPECGIQLLADPYTHAGSISENLGWPDGNPHLFRAIEDAHEWPDGFTLLGPCNEGSLEPGFADDKYSGGVVGIRAGSSQYPGAAILSASGAVHATPSMVRYVGPQAVEVVRAHPEIVATQRLEDAGRVQAWVFGPGTGTDADAFNDLAALIDRPEPLLIDADGLTLISNSATLVDRLRAREGFTVLTPHDGEFERLITTEWIAPADLPEHAGRFVETKALANALNCTIVRKGRSTIIVDPINQRASIVDTANSWAATPGSGDVLSGLMGARIARSVVRFGDRAAGLDLFQSVTIHAVAAQISANTPFGPGPTHASAIAAAIPAATAKITRIPNPPAAVSHPPARP